MSELSAIPAPGYLICEQLRPGGFTKSKGGIALPKESALSGSHRILPVGMIIGIGEGINNPGSGNDYDLGDLVAFDPSEVPPLSIRDPEDQGRIIIFLPIGRIVGIITGGISWD